MAHNPLLGSRISLISKKNIRYEGTLYSINETDATVALQNVRAYGTEGRESESESGTFVPAQDAVHAYLLFRGCDIKDLHVHENQQPGDGQIPSDPAILSAEKPTSTPSDDDEKTETRGETATATATDTASVTDEAETAQAQSGETTENKAKTSIGKTHMAPAQKKDSRAHGKEGQHGNTGDSADHPSPKSNKTNNKLSNNNNNAGRRKKNNNNPKQMVGSGASLLRRKARGVVDGENGPENANEKNFDFESNLAEFTKTNDEDDDDDDDDESNEEENSGAYQKDDFFDSLSCDVSDRQNGLDNRLRGREERSMNTETFGATSLGYGRRNNRRYRGRGGGGGRGRSGGRGRGRGNGDGRPRENNRWKDGNQSSGGRGGNRRTYGDGGLSAHSAVDGQ